MARGFAGVREAREDIERRRNSASTFDDRLWFKLPKSGDSAVVRFLEQGDDVAWAWTHELPPKGNQKWGDSEPCRDQDRSGERCPGCEKGMPRGFLGFINLIWRDGPVYKKDEKGWLVKDSNGNLVVESRADQVAFWQAGITVFEMLDNKDVTFKGLTSRDFRVTRRGTGLETKYEVEPADPDGGPQPMSAADEELAKEKYDFTNDVTPRDYDSWGGSGDGGSSEPQREVPEDSPFLRN